MTEGAQPPPPPPPAVVAPNATAEAPVVAAKAEPEQQPPPEATDPPKEQPSAPAENPADALKPAEAPVASPAIASAAVTPAVPAVVPIAAAPAAAVPTTAAAPPADVPAEISDASAATSTTAPATVPETTAPAPVPNPALAPAAPAVPQAAFAPQVPPPQAPTTPAIAPPAAHPAPPPQAPTTTPAITPPAAHPVATIPVTTAAPSAATSAATTAVATTAMAVAAAAAATPTATSATPAMTTIAAAAMAAAVAATTPAPKAPTTPASVPTKIIPAIPLPEPERDPNIPTDRDAIVDLDRHTGTMLLLDLVRLHYFLWKKKQQQQQRPPAAKPAVKQEQASDLPVKQEESAAPSSKPEEVAAPPTKLESPPAAPVKQEEPPAASMKNEEPSASSVEKEEPSASSVTPTESKMEIEPAEASVKPVEEEAAQTAASAGTASRVEPPKEAKDVEYLTTRLFEHFKKGRKYELSGLKDVPTPFFKGEGRFFEKIPFTESETDEKKKWKRLDDTEAKTCVSNLVLKSFKAFSESDNREAEKAATAMDTGAEDSPAVATAKSVDTLFDNLKDEKTGEEARSDPRPYDVLLLPVESPWEESMNYEHQSGNKNLLYLASQHVSVETKESISRIKAAFALITAKVQVSSGTELVTQNQRFVIQRSCDSAAQSAVPATPAQQQHKMWKNMERDDLAEFAAIFVFEVYLEKRIYEETIIGNNIVDNVGTPVTPRSTQAAMKDLLSPSDANKPSDVPIPNPTTHDVLFGRGGMTNGHPGNRRFRDIIALHRPDYVRATKMDKPNVARKIVRAIRQGNPPGRFLRKSSDGMWRDVGDKVAAEKTSQGLRERSNAEKRQRSAMRESLRIGRGSLGGGSVGDGSVGADGTPSGKKMKLAGGIAIGVGGALNGNIVPLTLTTKKSGGSGKKSKNGINGPDEENATESLPPNAVDKNGNLLVTDHDILCGRGGLTNHHKGNKRFRDIVALHRPDYVRAPKIQKPSVARVIVRAIRNGDPPGRFLKKDATTDKWFDIGDKKAAEKTSQALREKSDDEKEGKIPFGFASPTLIVPTNTANTVAAAAASNIDATLTDATAAATRMMASSATAAAMEQHRVAAAAAAAAATTPGMKIEDSAAGVFAAAIAATAVGGKPVGGDPKAMIVADGATSPKTDLSVKREDVEKAKEFHVEV